MTKPLPVHGADLSHNNESVNLQVAQEAGLQWVYHKATQGRMFVDDMYESRRGDASFLELPFGAYHFSEATSSAREQMAHFMEIANPKAGDMRPMLDVEDSGGSFFSKMSLGARTAWVEEAVTFIEDEVGMKPFIYTPFDLGDTFGCPLWVARYSNENAAPNVPTPWVTYTIRQFSNGEFGVPKVFPGLKKVDLNCWRTDTSPERMLALNRLVGDSRGQHVDRAIAHLNHALKNAKDDKRVRRLKKAIKILNKIQPS